MALYLLSIMYSCLRGGITVDFSGPGENARTSANGECPGGGCNAFLDQLDHLGILGVESLANT